MICIQYIQSICKSYLLIYVPSGLGKHAPQYMRLDLSQVRRGRMWQESHTQGLPASSTIDSTPCPSTV